MTEANEHGETFGAWLLAQKERTGWVGELAKAAKTDRAFTRDSTPEDLRKRLRETMAEGDMYEAVDDAENDWLSY